MPPEQRWSNGGVDGRTDDRARCHSGSRGTNRPDRRGCTGHGSSTHAGFGLGCRTHPGRRRRNTAPRRHPAFGRNPVGTGPFKFGEWRPSDRVILQRNDNYWITGADGKAQPYLDGITTRLIIDDSVRAVKLRSHNIDYTDQIAPRDMASVKADHSST